MTANSATGAQASRAGDGGPADQHGHAPGDAAPHDVLRRAALEHASCSRRRRAGSPPGPARPRDRVDEQREPGDATPRPAPAPKTSAAAGLTSPVTSGRRLVRFISRRCPGRARSSGCSPSRPRRCRRPAWRARAPTGRQPSRGEQHRRDGGDQQQLDDPGLGQRDVGADARAGARAGRSRGAARPRGAPSAADRGVRRHAAHVGRLRSPSGGSCRVGQASGACPW